MTVLEECRISSERKEFALGRLFSRVQETGHPNLQSLSVFLGRGVVPRAERSDNHNRLGSDLGKYQRVQPGDVVFNKLRTWQGGFGVSEYTGIVSPAYIVCRRESKEIEPRFIHHLLRSDPYLAELKRLSKWMPPSQFDISWEEIRAMRVSVPPLREQREIVAFLDDQIERVDEVMKARARQASLLKEQFLARLDQLYESCRTFPLNHFVAPGRPINYGVLMPGPHFPGGVPLVEAGDLSRGPLEEESLRRTDPSIEAEYSRSRLLPGDLVIAIRGSVGSVRVVPPSVVGANVTRDAARLSIDSSKASADFIRYALMAPRTQSWLEIRLLGSAVRGINIGDLRRVPIPSLTIAAQVEFQCWFAGLETEQARLADALSASIDMLGDLKRSLITAAVTGELDVPLSFTSRLSA